MHIAPDISALRQDDQPQRAAQAAMAQAVREWRSRPDVAQLHEELAAFSSCRTFAECPLLATLFEDANPAAQIFVEEYVSAMAAAIGRHPLGQIAMRHFADGKVSNIQLARTARTTLMLVALDGVALARAPTPTSANFSPAESWDHILAGKAFATLIEARPPAAPQVEFHRRDVLLLPGKVIAREGSRQTMQIGRIEGRLVTLRLVRRHEKPGPAREYELASGRLIHQAAGNAAESRLEFMVSLLGRMGRADAAPELADIALEDWGEGLRWEALRQCLSLDTATGFAVLSRLAERSGDSLAIPAQTLRRGLVDLHPQLEEIG